MRPLRVVLVIVAALYAIVLATGLGAFDVGQSGPSNAFAYEYSTTITTSTTTTTSSSTSTTTTTTPTTTKPGKGCGDKNHLHERRFECNVKIADFAAKEGNNGSKSFSFTVALSGTAIDPVTVDFATAPGSATAGGDFASVSGTLTFAPDQETAVVTVPVAGDTTREANETFYVNLSNPSPNAYLGDSQGLGTISNDD